MNRLVFAAVIVVVLLNLPASAQDAPDCTTPRLVLDIPADPNPNALLNAFSYLRQNRIRTLIIARPDTDPDTLRLVVATGNMVAPKIEMLQDAEVVERQLQVWEATLADVLGRPGRQLIYPFLYDTLPPALLDDWRAELRARDYTPLIDLAPGCDTLPPFIPIPLDEHAISKIHGAQANGATPHEAGAWYYARPAAEAPTTPGAFKAAHLIVIDPGHTEMDRGTAIRGTDGEYVSEHWSNLQRAHVLRDFLRQDGWAAILAHDGGWLYQNPYHGLDMDRDGLINNHDNLVFRAQFAYYASLRTGRRAVVLMLHADSASDPGTAGYTVFYPNPSETADTDTSYRLAEHVAAHLGQAWEAMGVDSPNRGLYPGLAYGAEHGPGAIYDIIDWRYRELAALYHDTPPPAFVSVLIEAGMGSRPAEAAMLASEKGNAWIGRAHAQALNTWMRAELGWNP